MRIRRLLCAAAVVTLFAGWSASAAEAAETAVPAPGPTAQADATGGIVAASGLGAGIMPIGGGPQSAAAPSTARLFYYGGKVISNVAVTKVLYGTGTYTTSVTGTGPGTVAAFYTGVTNSAYMDWLTEYNTPTQQIGRGTYAGQVQLSPSAGNLPTAGGTTCSGTSTLNDTQIQAQLRAAVAGGILTPTANSYYAVYVPQGVAVLSGTARSGCQFCAYHGTVAATATNPEFYYGVLPDVTTAGMALGCGTGTDFQRESQIGSHELIEAVTDPEVGLATVYGPPLGWYAQVWNGEITDICSPQAADVVGGDGQTYSVALNFSNVQQDCIAVSGPPALLRVQTSPAVPSQITVDGSIADTWGLTWMKIGAGQHTVCFRDVPGYAAPACQVVNTSVGATTTVTGTFTQLTSLRVITSPAVPSTISIDGTPRNDWGVWSDFTPGSHQICFGAVAGFTPPPCANVNLVAGTPLVVTGTFTANANATGPSGFGTLHVTTSPALPSRISVDGSTADTWGTWYKIAPGQHTVCFGGVEGYATPACQVVNVTAGLETAVTGTFTQYGFLRVITSPASPATIIVGFSGYPNLGRRNDWGMWTDLPPSTYTVCATGLSGKFTPSCVNANVAAGATTTVTLTFT